MHYKSDYPSLIYMILQGVFDFSNVPAGPLTLFPQVHIGRGRQDRRQQGDTRR